MRPPKIRLAPTSASKSLGTVGTPRDIVGHMPWATKCCIKHFAVRLGFRPFHHEKTLARGNTLEHLALWQHLTASSNGRGLHKN